MNMVLGAVQMPFNQILLVMRKDKFYGRFVNYIGEAAEAGFASMYLTGVAVKVLCQFVPAGVQDRNPFTRKDNLYNVVDYDRYVYHIVGIEQPADPILVGAIMYLSNRLWTTLVLPLLPSVRLKLKQLVLLLLQ